MAKSDLLAVAFTDLNGNDKYNPGKDELIAALVDTNKDGIPSIGDTIEWGTYPAILSGSNSGTGGIYTSSDDTVSAVQLVNDTAVIVLTPDGGAVTWSADQNSEGFVTSGSLGSESILRDSITLPMVIDGIFADPFVPGPGLPNTPINVETPQLGDQGFLEVQIFSTGWDLF